VPWTFRVKEIATARYELRLHESILMRRIALTLLAFLYAASACFGTSGTWRCANGTPCAFTPGVGFHCPGVKPSPPSSLAAAQRAGGMCPHCRPQTLTPTKIASSSGPCALVCRGCHCQFTVISSHVPATTGHAISIPTLYAGDFPAVFFGSPAPAVGFSVRPIVFTTGPPGSFSKTLPLTTPSRAPPHRLSA
jgi:hypothetical protein